MTSTDYQAISATGHLIRTFQTRPQALAWWREHADDFPGCIVKEVTVSVVERTIYRQRSQLRAVA